MNKEQTTINKRHRGLHHADAFGLLFGGLDIEIPGFPTAADRVRPATMAEACVVGIGTETPRGRLGWV